MTNWDSRTIEIDFSFLEEGVYEVDIFEDGMNADVYKRQDNTICCILFIYSNIIV